LKCVSCTVVELFDVRNNATLKLGLMGHSKSSGMTVR